MGDDVAEVAQAKSARLEFGFFDLQLPPRPINHDRSRYSMLAEMERRGGHFPPCLRPRSEGGCPKRECLAEQLRRDEILCPVEHRGIEQSPVQLCGTHIRHPWLIWAEDAEASLDQLVNELIIQPRLVPADWHTVLACLLYGDLDGLDKPVLAPAALFEKELDILVATVNWSGDNAMIGLTSKNDRFPCYLLASEVPV